MWLLIPHTCVTCLTTTGSIFFVLSTVKWASAPSDLCCRLPPADSPVTMAAALSPPSTSDLGSESYVAVGGQRRAQSCFGCHQRSSFQFPFHPQTYIRVWTRDLLAFFFVVFFFMADGDIKRAGRLVASIMPHFLFACVFYFLHFLRNYSLILTQIRNKIAEHQWMQVNKDACR